MKNTAFLMLSLLSLATAFAQDKVLTKTGKVTFEASVPSFEEVKANHKAVTCILNTKTGEIASLILVKGFQFKVALMEEHFNENYIESDKFPKATFKGKIENFDWDKITAQPQDYTIKGKIELHGKSKDVVLASKIKKSGNGIEITSNFTLNPEDFDIQIPSLVRAKVAKNVAVRLDFILL
ncbi:YceI family protein [Flavobacterium humi]|uniref:YceI family protein n=1 Tax=Flavobacterium humi TaxID=2562683 RepID=A0A4Z0L455_9FLAO|nr:YceI family protein [Flavobacterium humi]TGD56729.1 YceI family protein [Flavobacterium humi]